MSGDMIKRRNPDVLARLEKFYETSGLSMAAIAKKSGTSESYVSRYLNTDSAPVGDVEGFEAAINDMIATASRRRKWDEVYFDTEAIEKCLLMFDLIDQSNEVGLVYGPAGIGKTTACKRHASLHDTAIHICVREGDGAWFGLVRALWTAGRKPLREMQCWRLWSGTGNAPVLSRRCRCWRWHATRYIG